MDENEETASGRYHMKFCVTDIIGIGCAMRHVGSGCMHGGWLCGVRVYACGTDYRYFTIVSEVSTLVRLSTRSIYKLNV